MEIAAHVALSARSDSEVGEFFGALEKLISGGHLNVNLPDAQV